MDTVARDAIALLQVDRDTHRLELVMYDLNEVLHLDILM